MGIMDLADKGSAETAEPVESTETAAPEPVETAPVAPAEPVAVPIPQPRLSRAARAAEETKKEVGEMRRMVEEIRQNKDQEIGRLRAELSQRQQPVYVQPQPVQQQPAEPDPDDLLRKADQALTASSRGETGKWDEYRQLERQAYSIIAQRAARGVIPQQQAAPASDPILAATLAQYPDVTRAGQAGINLAIAEDNRLAAMGYPPSYDRYHAALSAATGTIQAARNGGKAPGPQYDRSSAAALASGPTGRGNGQAASNGAPAMMMNADEERTWRAIAAKSGMSWEEYMSYQAKAHPEWIRR